MDGLHERIDSSKIIRKSNAQPKGHGNEYTFVTFNTNMQQEYDIIFTNHVIKMTEQARNCSTIRSGIGTVVNFSCLLLLLFVLLLLLFVLFLLLLLLYYIQFNLIYSSTYRLDIRAHTHSHRHTHTHTLTYTYSHTHTHACTHARTRTHTHPHTFTLTHM